MFDLIDKLIESVTRYGLEKVFNRYYSIYEGVVTENADPLRIGRVQVQVPILGEDPLENLAIPMNHRIAALGKGEFFPPEVGDQVWIMFRQGDLRAPVYMGGNHGAPEGASETNERFVHEDDQPKVRGFISAYGHKILFDEQDGKAKLTIESPSEEQGDEDASHKMTFEMEPGKQKIVFTTAGGHFLVLDDTEGAEAVFLIHKNGSQIQISPEGNILVADLSGNTISLNAESGAASLVSSAGSILALDKMIVIAESTGKSLISMDDSKIQITSAGDAIIQCKSVTNKAGSYIVDDGIAQIKVGSGKVFIGTPAAELVDIMIKTLDAALNDPVPATCGVGPVSPLSGLMKVQFTLLKVLLSTIKST